MHFIATPFIKVTAFSDFDYKYHKYHKINGCTKYRFAASKETILSWLTNWLEHSVQPVFPGERLFYTKLHTKVSQGAFSVPDCIKTW